MEKEKKYSHTISNNLYMLKLIWNVNPDRIVHVFLHAVIRNIQQIFYSVIFMRFLFGSAENIRGFRETAIFAAAAAFITAFAEYYKTWYNHRYIRLSDNTLQYEINKILFEKASAVDISCYENPDFFEGYTKALTEAGTRAMSVLESLAGIFGSLIASFAIIGTMYGIHKTAALFVIFPVAANFLFGKMINKINYDKYHADVPYDRRQEYVNRVMFLQKYAKEIRLSKITGLLMKTHQDSCDGKIKNIDHFFKKLLFPESMKFMCLFILPFTCLWIYLFYCATITKSINTGDFVMLSSAIVSATWTLIGLTDNIVTALSNGLYINNLKEFLTYKEKISEDQEGILPSKKVESLEFVHVSFRYDGASAYSLEDVSLRITEGEKIALVGINGAGKTTLIKLIMRLYDPTEGEILLNGTNIKEYDLKAYRSLISTVFQDYQILSMTILENVMMHPVTEDAMREKAVNALKSCGLYEKITELPNGADSILTREFDEEGIVLSGGQMQKIAAARAFAKDSSILILDEPSSALDPVAEYQLYETMHRLCGSSKNGTAKIGIFISHRLSSAVMADRVIFFEDGKIIEEGTHKELLFQNGYYYDMYQKQAESYLSGEEIL